MTTGFKWNSTFVNDAQQLCAYETVTVGYSRWCDLFTWQEWLDFEQSIDIDIAGTYGFQSPTGRAVGVGYVEEVLARLTHHYITKATGSVNGKQATFTPNQEELLIKRNSDPRQHAVHISTPPNPQLRLLSRCQHCCLTTSFRFEAIRRFHLSQEIPSRSRSCCFTRGAFRGKQ